MYSIRTVLLFIFSEISEWVIIGVVAYVHGQEHRIFYDFIDGGDRNIRI